MQYVPAEKVTIEHIRMVQKSLDTAPVYERISIEDILHKLAKKEAMLFEIPLGIVVVSVLDGAYEKRLSILAIYNENWGAHCRGVITDLKRLAAEWGCANIETCVYRTPLLKIILKLGGRVESVNLTMAVETDNGQQEKIDHHSELHPNGRPA